MKKFVFFALCLFTIASCNNTKDVNKENNDENKDTLAERAVGGDKDKHGCLPSAGESWSELKQSCIQVFNVGVRLNPVDVKENEAIISAFVVFSDDKSKLELFLPDNDKQTTILDKSEGDIYQNSIYKFDAKTSTLYVDGVEEYKK